MKPAELYALEPISTTHDLYQMERHSEALQSNALDWPKWENGDQRITLKYYADYSSDGERVWEVFSVWLDEQPVMICQEAGRGGNDDYSRFITNRKLFDKMEEYIRSFTEYNDDILNEVYEEQEEIKELGNFYNCTLSEFYDANLKPKYKVGDIVIGKAPKDNSYNSEMIETRVEIERLYKFNPTFTYFGKQLDRKFCHKKRKIIATRRGGGTQGCRLNDDLIVGMAKK